MAAALIGDCALLQFLSTGESGADLSVRNSDARTAAFFAAMNGHTDCLAFILGDADYGEDGGGGGGGTSGEEIGETTTFNATNGSAGVSGAAAAAAATTADAADKIGCTPLWTAAAHGHLDTVKYLIDRHGASPNARDVTGTTAAWMTVRYWCIWPLHTYPEFAFPRFFALACANHSFYESRVQPRRAETGADGGLNVCFT